MHRPYRYGVIMSDWRRSSTVAVIAVSLFIMVQLAIPLFRVGNQDLQRFGWQMYSSARPSPEFTVYTTTGSETIDLEQYMARIRLDISLEELMPPHLCAVVPGAESVTWDDSVHQC